MAEARKKYHRRGKGEAPPVLELIIVRKPNRQYALEHFSMLTLRALEEYHDEVNLPRKWRLSKDEKTLWLE